MQHLRDDLLRALEPLPGARTFHLYTLVSAPERETELFVYAKTRPKAYARHIFVLLAQHPPDAPTERVFVCAIEAFLYSIPSTQSAILYISKVDSTGQSSPDLRPNPTTTLVDAFFAHYTSSSTRPASHMWVQLFARAQNQYIFPNSAEYPGKRVLRDVKLCKWWKGVFESSIGRSIGDNTNIHLYYIMPGYSAGEARLLLGESATAAQQSSLPWTYSHPYDQTHTPIPSGDAPSTNPEDETGPHYSLASLIPSFPDDPKTRFMDEIASSPSSHDEETKPASSSSTAPSSPPSKRARVDTSSRPTNPNAPPKITSSARKALASVSLSEFWERMGFRQECAQGATTAFFTAIISPSSSTSSDKPASSSTITGTTTDDDAVPRAIIERVLGILMNLDFGSQQSARRATGILEEGIRGVCSGMTVSGKSHGGGDGGDGTDPDPSLSLETETTKVDLDEEGKVTPNPNPTKQPPSSLFERSIYGTFTIRNPPLPTSPSTSTSPTSTTAEGNSNHPSGEVKVNVLQVRKKKRPAPTF